MAQLREALPSPPSTATAVPAIQTDADGNPIVDAEFDDTTPEVQPTPQPAAGGGASTFLILGAVGVGLFFLARKM